MVSYTAPGITVTQTGPTLPAPTGPTAQVLALVGTAPQGPDYPVLCTAQTIAQLFGAPSVSGSVGYTLPFAAYFAAQQKQPSGNTPFTYLMMRVGVTRAAATLLDQTGSPLNAITLQGIGAYAGSAGNYLRAVVASQGSPTSVPATITIQQTTSGQTGTNQVESVAITGGPTGGTFTLTYAAQTTSTLAIGATAAQVQTALAALSTIGAGNVAVVGPAGGPWTVTFKGALGSTLLSALTAANTFTGGSSPAVAIQTITAGVAGVSAVQTVTLNNTPTGGTFTLSYGGQTTSGQAYNASAATIQSALQGLSSIGSGNATVAGSAGGPYTVTFASALANQPIVLMTASAASLTTASVYLPLTIIINDTTSGSPVQKQIFSSAQYDLSSNAKIVAAINGANPLTNVASIVQASVANAAATVPVAVTASLSGGADGQGTQASDPSVVTALQNSLWTHADYITPLFDAAQIGAAMLTHLNAGVAQNEFRKAIMGPKLGVSYNALVTAPSSYPGVQSSRFGCVGHDGGMATSPTTGQLTAWDGFFIAAAYAGLLSVGPRYETAQGFVLGGFGLLTQPSDLSGPLTPAQIAAGSAAGLMMLAPNQQGSGLVTVNTLTTAPYATNNAINPFSQMNVQSIDDAVANAHVAAVTPYKGRPSSSLTQQMQSIQNSVAAALGALGTIINGVNSVGVTADPATGAPTVATSYKTRYPNQQINIQTTFTFT